MGGSGGGGSSGFGRPSQPDQPQPGAPVGGPGGGGTDPCRKITFETLLQSPVPAVVAQLQVGEILHVELTNNRPPIIVLRQNGTIVGAIIPQNIRQLVDCINAGNHYVAEVVRIQGGAVTLRVRIQ